LWLADEKSFAEMYSYNTSATNKRGFFNAYSNKKAPLRQQGSVGFRHKTDDIDYYNIIERVTIYLFPHWFCIKRQLRNKAV
jgi:hypothetical protein